MRSSHSHWYLCLTSMNWWVVTCRSHADHMLTVSHADHMLVTCTSHAVYHSEFAGHNGYLFVHTKVCVCESHVLTCMWVSVHTCLSHACHMPAYTHTSLVRCWSHTPCLHVTPSSLHHCAGVAAIRLATNWLGRLESKHRVWVRIQCRASHHKGVWLYVLYVLTLWRYFTVCVCIHTCVCVVYTYRCACVCLCEYSTV